MKGANCIRGRTKLLRGDEAATTIPFVTPASPFLAPRSPIPFEATLDSTTILGHDLAPPGRPLRLVLPTHTFDPSHLSLQSSPLPSPLHHQLNMESPLSSSYSSSSHNPYFPFQGHSHSDDLQPHHAPAQLPLQLPPSSPQHQSHLLNMEWPANNQTYPSFTQDLDLDVPHPPPSAASTSSSSSWERVAMPPPPQEPNQSPLHQETTLPLFTSTHPTQPPLLPQAPRRPPSTTTRVNERSQAQMAPTTMPPPVRYASTSPPGAAQASSSVSTSVASAGPARLQIVTSAMTMDPNRDLNLAASQSWNSATTTNNAHLHLPHGNSLQPDLEHFYYQQQRQRQQLVVDMGMEAGMAMAGMAAAAAMGAPRAPLPRQDSSLRLRRSISSIAQARHQANQRHHSNTNSPTSTNWELGMEAYRQQQQAERQRRSSEEAEYIQRLSASYHSNNNNNQAIHMHPSHPTQHPTLQRPPLHSPQGYYHPQRHHPQGISHPHSDLSNNNNHTLPNTLNTHHHPHTLHHSHSNNSLNIPRPNNSSSTSSSINNSPIHPHFPTHPLHPAGATAHDHHSQIHHRQAYVMHEETEGFGPHTTNNSNSSLEVAAGMVMAADSMPVHSNSMAKFASASFLTPTLHLG